MRYRQTCHAAFAASRLRGSSVGIWRRSAHDPAAARPSQLEHHGPIPALGDQQGLRNAKSAGLAEVGRAIACRTRSRRRLRAALMAKDGLEAADIFSRYGEAYRHAHGASLSTAQRRAMSAIELCRTAALGGHIERCDNCEHERVAYNSCRNRHCPKCQSLSRAKWLAARQSKWFPMCVLERR